MENRITKDMKIKEIEEILDDHNIYKPNLWELVLWGLLNDCDYIEVVGYGNNAEFVKRYN